MQNLTPVFIVLIVSVITGCWGALLFWGMKRIRRESAQRDVVQERIRREVREEFEQTLQQSSGPRKWWLVLRREAEIQKRAGRVIHEKRGP